MKTGFNILIFTSSTIPEKLKTNYFAITNFFHNIVAQDYTSENRTPPAKQGETSDTIRLVKNETGLQELQGGGCRQKRLPLTTKPLVSEGRQDLRPLL
jgi:hypothetical protein